MSTERAIVPVDILDGQFSVHWTLADKLFNVLKIGLVSPAFAKRIDLPPDQYVDNSGLGGTMNRYVFASRSLDPRQGGFDFPDGPAVGILLKRRVYRGDVNTSIKLRVKPKEFLGLLVENDGGDILDRIILIDQSAENQVPIYGTLGDMVWPRRMSHAEIVAELGRKNEVQ